jgi:hypothetical protein
MNKERQVAARPWQKPELTVLVRSKPEEAVLRSCKSDTASAGNASAQGNCTFTICYVCSTAGGVS